MPDSPLLLVIDSDNCRVMCGYGDFLGTKFVIVSEGYALIDENDNVVFEHVGEEGVELDMETAVRAFELHDEGYIFLDSFGEVYRDITASWSANSNTVYVEADIPLPLDTFVGKFIHLNSEWKKIVDILDDGALVIEETLTEADNQNTIVTTMNELIIEGEGLSLDNISATYSPRVL